MKSRYIKRFIAILIAALMITSILSACGNSESKDDSSKSTSTQVQADNSKENKPVMEKTKVVIFRAGGIVERKDDNLVKEAIEKKLLEDTGLNLDLDVKLYSNEDFKTKINLALAAGDQVDCIGNYIGQFDGDGLAALIGKPGLIKPLNEMVDKFGLNLKKAIPEEAWSAITYNGTIMGIPDVANTSIFGILIRKDWLDEAGMSEPKTLAEFENMLEAFKNRGKDVIPMVGMPWDTDRVIFPGALGTYPFWSYFKDTKDGLFKPVTLDPNYKKVVEAQYKWVIKGWWDKDNRSRSWDDTLNVFISGKAGVFIAWPEITNLIDISRKTKEVNPQAKFDVLGPLEGPDGKKGFYKNPMAFGAIAIPQKSKNAEYVVKYLDWLCSDKANYDLSYFGESGVHWIEPADDIWAFPEGKEKAYATEPPYSGKYRLLTWVTVSDRISADYDEQEREWIKKVKGFEVFEDQNAGLVIPNIEQFADLYKKYNDELYNNSIIPATAGLTDPAGTYDKYRDQLESKLAEYWKALTDDMNKQLEAK